MYSCAFPCGTFGKYRALLISVEIKNSRYNFEVLYTLNFLDILIVLLDTLVPHMHSIRQEFVFWTCVYDLVQTTLNVEHTNVWVEYIIYNELMISVIFCSQKMFVECKWTVWSRPDTVVFCKKTLSALFVKKRCDPSSKERDREMAKLKSNCANTPQKRPASWS